MLLAFGVQSALHQTALANGMGGFSHVGGWFTSAKIAPGAASISERPSEKKAGSRYLLPHDLSCAGRHIQTDVNDFDLTKNKRFPPYRMHQLGYCSAGSGNHFSITALCLQSGCAGNSPGLLGLVLGLALGWLFALGFAQHLQAFPIRGTAGSVNFHASGLLTGAHALLEPVEKGTRSYPL